MQKNNVERIFLFLELLKTHTDENDILSMTEIISELSEQGYKTNRKTIYEYVDVLRKNGFDIRYLQKDKYNQGYYYVPLFRDSEIMVLIDAIKNNLSLSEKESEELIQKITSLQEKKGNKVMIESSNLVQKTDNESSLENIEKLLHAIYKKQYVSFYYYDLTIQKTRKYHHNKQLYTLVPYAIVSQNNRYYMIGYSEERKDYLTFRIDKIDTLTVLDKCEEERLFDLEQWMKSSVNMFKGKPQTITCRFDKSMANRIFDQFGSDFIVSKVEEEYFIASIYTAITPTLIAWLFQFHSYVTVIKPKSLIDDMIALADEVKKTYGKESR